MNIRGCLILAVLLAGTGCVETFGTRASAPAGSGAEDELIDFEYTLIPGGERARWVLMHIAAHPRREGVLVSDFDCYTFDDDGDGIMQENEKYGEASRRGPWQRWGGLPPVFVEYEMVNPWVYMRIVTTEGEVVRTWKLDLPP